MEPRSQFLVALVTAVSLTAAAAALFPSDALNSPAPKAIADLREAIVKGLGTQAEGVSLTGFDVRDALVGQALSYEFSIEVNNEEIPVRLLEDVSRWDFVDLPIFRSEVEGEGNVLVKPGMRTDGVVPVLAPFQLAGPMELWIQDGDDMRLALPHDVDAGKLKKVILSDGAVVTVKGARSVSLRHPLELPLPLNRTNHQSNPFASGLLNIADALRQSSRNDEIPLLSLRIVGPTSITSTPSESVSDKLKLKLLAPGLVQLSSRSIPSVTGDVDESTSTLWPLTSLNGSDATLMGIEELLASVLRKKGSSEGSFRLVKADVSARTYVKMGFVVEKKLLGEEVGWFDFPEWKTKPEKVRAHYEVLARVEENGKVIPERIAEVHPFQVQESFEESLLTGNVSMSHVPIVHPPPTYFTL